MTIEKLNEVHFINKEIEKLERELYHLRNKNFYKGNRLTGMPKNKTQIDLFAEYADRICRLEAMIEYSYDQLTKRREEAENFINSIEDSEMRLIIRMRTFDNMKWEDIGRELGMERTTVSKKFNKLFLEHNNSHNSHMNAVI